jgi:hypothetical protein
MEFMAELSLQNLLATLFSARLYSIPRLQASTSLRMAFTRNLFKGDRRGRRLKENQQYTVIELLYSKHTLIQVQCRSTIESNALCLV